MSEKRVINALNIEDDPFSVAILRYYGDNLKDFRLNIKHTVTLEDSLNFLDNHNDIELIFLDYRIQHKITGMEILQHIRAKGIRTPIIVITGSGDEMIATAMMKAGASDYLVKGMIDVEMLEKAIKESLDKHAKIMQINERNVHERILKEMALQTSLSAVALLNMDGDMIYLNQTFVEMWGYESEQELSGKPLKSCFAQPERFDELLKGLNQKKKLAR
ncbi:MAG: response regulator [Candidatus Omnitrophota bacterium]